MNRLLFVILTIFTTLSAKSQIDWSAEVITDSPTSGHIVLKVDVEKGYHFYAFPPEGGINSLEIVASASNGVELFNPEPSVEPVIEYSAPMQQTLASWHDDVEFSIPFTLNDVAGANFSVYVRYQFCNDTQCFTPQKKQFDLHFGAATEAEPNAVSISTATDANETNDADKGVVSTGPVASYAQISQWWEPIETASPASDKSPWAILIIGFLGGLAALLTPCVWPMIPMTLSFFLKKGKATNKSKRDALTYGISIILIYLILGLAITLIFGASKLNALSTSALFNIIFFVLLVVFAVSFFGAFDIKLPSKWSNAIDAKAENTTGVLSIFFMAFTLALVSFSCTGPIIGTLLVEAASRGSLLGPALGMGGFALGLALPFSIFALFPSMLKEMPKSGGWLNTVKVVLGFIELILSLKFLSVADMAYGWGLLNRDVFITLWIVLFALLGLYLLGKIRFAHDDKVEKLSVGRFFLALVSLSVALYMLPGLWGAPLKAFSAFVPPIETQAFNLHNHTTDYIEFDDYDAAMQYGIENNRPVLVDFSGWGCVNCRKMEAEVFDTESVRKVLAEDFVVVKLMVDEKAALSEPFVVTEGDQTLTLTTVGEKWSYLQSHKFGANSQPYYIVLNGKGEALSEPVYYDSNVDSFITWLEVAAAKY